MRSLEKEYWKTHNEICEIDLRGKDGNHCLPNPDNYKRYKELESKLYDITHQIMIEIRDEKLNGK